MEPLKVDPNSTNSTDSSTGDAKVRNATQVSSRPLLAARRERTYPASAGTARCRLRLPSESPSTWPR